MYLKVGKHKLSVYLIGQGGGFMQNNASGMVNLQVRRVWFYSLPFNIRLFQGYSHSKGMPYTGQCIGRPSVSHQDP